MFLFIYYNIGWCAVISQKSIRINKNQNQREEEKEKKIFIKHLIYRYNFDIHICTQFVIHIFV